MKKISVFVVVLAVTLALSSRRARVVLGSEGGPQPLLTHPIDDTQLVTLAGNTRPEANTAHDRGRLAESAPIEHMLLQLRRPCTRPLYRISY
jgi:hypothetical protein